MRTPVLPVLACAASVACAALVACSSASPPPGEGAPGSSAPGSSAPGPTVEGSSALGSAPPTPAEPGSAPPAEAPPAAAPPAAEPATAGVEYRVTYPFGVPSTRVVVSHPLTAPPLPRLVAIYVGNHPEGTPPYQRISFYFRGSFPSYNLQYVPAVLDEGRGEPIPLQGNAFLRVGFVEAQAHDDSGASTVKTSPPASIGFTNLKSYGFAGDFEGYVSYGLGIQVAPNSDQVLRIRAGELKKPDGSGGFYYVVHVDVQTG
jgi:hypothetical protein